MYVLDISWGKIIKIFDIYICICIIYSMENVSWIFDEGWIMEKVISYS